MTDQSIAYVAAAAIGALGRHVAPKVAKTAKAVTVKTGPQRQRAKTIAQLLNRYAWQCLYAQVRPMQTRSLTLKSLTSLLENGKDIEMDCSEAVTLIFRLAGFQDPNGLGYNGQGYTGTMLQHLPHFTDWAQVHVGTLIVFGAGTGTHVVMVVKPNGQNPLVYSHGSHARGAIWDLNTERQYHQGEPITLLAVAGL